MVPLISLVILSMILVKSQYIHVTSLCIVYIAQSTYVTDSIYSICHLINMNCC